MGIQERREREKRIRRQQIMIAAKNVFSDKGFNRTTMEDIANRAELSPGTLYLYFKNKEELYASLSIDIMEYLVERLENLLGQNNLGMGPEQKVDALMDVLFNVYEHDPLLIINVFHLQSSETLKNLSPELLSEIEKISRRAIGAFVKIYVEGRDKGLFIDKHPIALADILWSLFSGVVLWEDSKKTINKDKDFLKETLRIAFEVFIRGLKKTNK